MNPELLFRENLALIDRIIDRVCRRASLYGADAEDFASSVRLHLIDDDYAVLRKFEERCSFATYITIVVQRFLSTERMRAWGRFHASAEARRIGEVGLALEQLVRRDGRTVEEAFPIVKDLDPTLTLDGVRELVDRLPTRRARLRVVSPEDVEDELPVGAEVATEGKVIDSEAKKLSEDASRAMREALAHLSLEDRMLVRLRFEAAMTVAEIARAMKLPQRPLYRRLDRLLDDLRTALASAGVDRSSLETLIGSRTAEMDFGFTNVESGNFRHSLEETAGLDRSEQP
ncbi:MAG TPA: sigma-70 family RNA polymerase sigma factor [Thermoanaerobaculia bacterium]|nr:sigma-70 family RNA polymerase sigma factor [Thermoanaerobaculia bacterium]